MMLLKLSSIHGGPSTRLSPSRRFCRQTSANLPNFPKFFNRFSAPPTGPQPMPIANQQPTNALSVLDRSQPSKVLVFRLSPPCNPPCNPPSPFGPPPMCSPRPHGQGCVHQSGNQMATTRHFVPRNWRAAVTSRISANVGPIRPIAPRGLFSARTLRSQRSPSIR
jgi:hypothetical protein